MGCHCEQIPIVGAFGFFLFGLLGSLHCLGMCAPISTLFLNMAPTSVAGSVTGNADRLALYHGGRLLAYAGTGVVAALVGVQLRTVAALHWVMLALAIALLLYAAGVKMQLPSWLIQAATQLLARTGKNPARRALSIGLLTPLLPCGLLYAAVGAAAVAPNIYIGALWMGLFALGTIPLLFFGQIGLRQLLHRTGPLWQARFQRILAAAAAMAIFWVSYGNVALR